MKRYPPSRARIAEQRTCAACGLDYICLFWQRGQTCSRRCQTILGWRRRLGMEEAG